MVSVQTFAGRLDFERNDKVFLFRDGTRIVVKLFFPTWQEVATVENSDDIILFMPPEDESPVMLEVSRGSRT